MCIRDSLQTDQEDDDEDDYSTEKDEKCYDMIVGTISLKQTTGEEMVLAIDEMFGDNPSGYKLYLWLCARGKFDSDQLGTGIIDANATRLEVEQFKIPSGKLTPEVLDTAQRSFVRLFCKQPEGRQGIKGDMTVAWFEKLPKIPLNEAASNTAHVPILELIKRDVQPRSGQHAVRGLREVRGAPAQAIRRPRVEARRHHHHRQRHQLNEHGARRRLRWTRLWQRQGPWRTRPWAGTRRPA